eukprot:s3965_g1.t4
MVDMPRIWVMVPPRAPSFCPDTNPGLAPATSKLFYANFLKAELFAKRTAPRKPFVEVNTGLNTSLKRPKSAQMSALSRARSATSLDQGRTKDDSWPVPVDPETGRPVRPDPRQRQFYKTRSTLTMGVIDDVYSNPERKARPEMYMAQRYGVHAAHPVGFPGRYTPSACRVDSTGDLDPQGWPRAASLGARAAAPEVRCHPVRLQLGDRTFSNCCASAMIAMWAYGRPRESLRLWARILYGLTFAIYAGGLVQYAVAAAKLQVTMGTNVMLGAGNCLLSGIPLCVVVCCIGRTREEALNEHLSFRHHEQREEKRIAAFQEAHAAYAGYGAASYTTAGGTFDQPASFDQSWQQNYSQEGWPSWHGGKFDRKHGHSPARLRKFQNASPPPLRLFVIMFGGGMSFSQGGGSPEKPQKRADDRTNFLPDTASEAAKTGDGEVRFHGNEASPAMLTLLAQIEVRRRQ